MARRREVGEPIDARKIHVGFRAGIHQAGFTAAERGNENANGGILAAGDGIALQLGFTGVGFEVKQGKLRNFAFIHFEISDGRRIRRPPVTGIDIQLFGIDPVDFAFAENFAATGGDGALFAIGGGDDPEVMVANEADVLGVGRDFYVGEIFLAGDEDAAGLGFQIEPCYSVGTFEEQCFAVGGPLILRRGMTSGASGLRLLAGRGGENVFELVRGNQDRSFAGGCIERP